MKIISYIFILSIVNISFSQITVDQTWINQNSSDGALFFDQQGQTYTFQTDFSAAGTAVFVTADNVVIDLNGYTITFGTANRDGSIGINAFRQRSVSTLGSDDQNYSRTAQGGSGGNALLIKNGRVVWGGSGGTWATAVGGYYAGDYITIDNMYLESGSDDGAAVHIRWANIFLTNSYCVNNSNGTENRHAGPAAIKTEGRVVASNNIIIGGNSSIVCGSDSEIFNNVLRHNSFATNGYGVWLYRNSGVKAYNNLILPVNGRGILCNAGEDHLFYDNLIVTHEEPNQEYGETLNPTALRIRYDANNIEFRNNKSLSIGGTDLTAASGAYLSNDGGMQNLIHDNEFRAILRGSPDQRTYANAITFEQQGEASNFVMDKIENNFFGSNNYILRLAGFDGGCFQESIDNNTLSWINGNDTFSWFTNELADNKYNFSYSSNNDYVTEETLNTIKTEVTQEVKNLIENQPDDQERSTFFTGYYEYDSYITVVDAQLENGVEMNEADVFVLTGNGSEVGITIAHSLFIQAVDASSNAYSNRTIQVKDDQGISYTTTTDNSGIARLVLTEYVLSKPDGPDQVSRTTHSTYSAILDGVSEQTLPDDVKNNVNNPVVINFGGSGGSNIPGKPLNVKINP